MRFNNDDFVRFHPYSQLDVEGGDILDGDDGEGDDLGDEEGGGGKEEGMEIAPSAIPKHLKEDPDVSQSFLAQLFDTKATTCIEDLMSIKTTFCFPLNMAYH